MREVKNKNFILVDDELGGYGDMIKRALARRGIIT